MSALILHKKLNVSSTYYQKSGIIGYTSKRMFSSMKQKPPLFWTVQCASMLNSGSLLEDRNILPV